MAHRPSEAVPTPRSRANTGNTLQVASAAPRSRANTGSSVAKSSLANPDMLSTSIYSNTDSAEMSNGSLLDLYARSTASYADTGDSYPSEMPTTGHDPIHSPSPMTAARDFASSFKVEDQFALPPSDSNASIWTTASAANNSNPSLPGSKRPSFSGLDFPVSGTESTTLSAYATPLPPSAAVLPPDFDSDGSHYDDEPPSDTIDADATVRPDVPPPQSTLQPSPSLYSQSSRNFDQIQHEAGVDHDRAEEETFSNALPSPPVPRRISSFSKKGSSSPGRMQFDMPDQMSPLPGSHPEPSDVAAYTSLAGEQSTQAALSPVDESVPRSAVLDMAHEPSLDEQQRLERELLAEAADESRPRTLQEARERARLRKLQAEAAEAGSKDQSIRSKHARTTTAIIPEQGVRSSIDSKERPKRDPRRMSMREGERSDDGKSSSDHTAPSDYSHGSDAEVSRGYESATASLQRIGSTDSQTKNASHRLGLLPPAQVQRPASREMEDLTDAVNHAMNDLSFGSADEAFSADDDDGDGDFATPMPLPRATDARTEPREPPAASSQLAAVTREDDTPQFGPKTTSIRTLPSPLPSPAIRTPQGPLTPRGTGAHSTSYFQYQQQQSQPRAAATTPTATVVQRRQSQQPVLPKRIEVYGKNMAYPKAFTSSAIINNRRATSGERARMYAQCTNELLHIPTGLALWMEVVQRPAMRQPLNNARAAQNAKSADSWGGTMNALPVSGHVRNEGSYADSIRSDMTFPMRGDGAKAKEIVSVMPSVMESPAKPQLNLPYPGVMAPRSNSTQSFASSNSGGPVSSTGPGGDAYATVRSSAGTHRTAQSISGGFFGNLGRKNSKRTPAAPPPGNAFGMTTAASQPSLAGIANPAPRSRGYRTVREKSISGPVPQPASATNAADTGAGQPAGSTIAADSRASGLGLGGMEIDTSAPSSRRGTITDPRLSPSIPTYPGTIGASKGPRSPMGPRAPGTAPTSASASANASDAELASQGYHASNNGGGTNSLFVPDAAFGSGPTFVSRLGGGSIGSSGGSHPSPRTPSSTSPNAPAVHSQDHGLASPDHLHPSLPTSSSAHGQRSPRAERSPSSPAPSHYALSNTSNPPSPALGGGNTPLRASFSYGTMRDRMRRESNPAIDDTTFQETLVKLGDILPDADTAVLAHYLRKAKGDDLVAIGDYLQDQSLGKLPKYR